LNLPTSVLSWRIMLNRSFELAPILGSFDPQQVRLVFDRPLHSQRKAGPNPMRSVPGGD
jgi:hypothetical protein